jgi:hypothetical protein
VTNAGKKYIYSEYEFIEIMTSKKSEKKNAVLSQVNTLLSFTIVTSTYYDHMYSAILAT